MKKQHNWNIIPNYVHSTKILAVFICQNCQGVKVRDSRGKFHYFYQGTTQHC